jgi:3-phosphoglycerate kinase
MLLEGFGTLHPQMDDVRHVAEVRDGPCDGVLTDAEVRQLGQVVELRGNHTCHIVKSVKVGYIHEGTAPELNRT